MFVVLVIIGLGSVLPITSIVVSPVAIAFLENFLRQFLVFHRDCMRIYHWKSKVLAILVSMQLVGMHLVIAVQDSWYFWSKPLLEKGIGR